MALAKMDLNNIIKYDWDTPSEFSVVELSNKYLASKYNQIYDSEIFGIGTKTDIFVDDIRFESLASQEIAEYFAGGWSVAIGKLEKKKIVITFRDYNKATIYTKFANFQQILKDQYPKDQQWTIKVRKTSYMTKTGSGIGVDMNSLLGKAISAVSSIFGVNIPTSTSALFGGSVGGVTYLINTQAAVILSVTCDQVGHSFDNQFTKVAVEFVYTDNLPLADVPPPSKSEGGFMDSLSSWWGGDSGGGGESVPSTSNPADSFTPKNNEKTTTYTIDDSGEMFLNDNGL